MAEDARNLKRRHLVYYLEVYDENTEALLGHMVDITTEGIKLVSKNAIQTDKVFKLRMMLPESYFPEKKLHFEARSKWSRNAVNPDLYDTGFEVWGLDAEARKVISGLINLLGFND